MAATVYQFNKTYVTLSQVKLIRFLSPFEGSDIRLVVGRDKVGVYATRSVIAKASPTLAAAIAFENTDGEVYISNISDVEGFVVMIALIHLGGIHKEDVREETTVLQLLPMLKHYDLTDLSEYCEGVLCQLPPRLLYCVVAEENGFSRLQQRMHEWLESQDASELMRHDEWGVVSSNYRLQLFPHFLSIKDDVIKSLRSDLKEKERLIAKLIKDKEVERLKINLQAKADEVKRLEVDMQVKTKEMEKLKERLQVKDAELKILNRKCREAEHSYSFVYDILELTAGKIHDVEAPLTSSGLCDWNEYRAHELGTNMECKECLRFVVKNVRPIYKHYKI